MRTPVPLALGLVLALASCQTAPPTDPTLAAARRREAVALACLEAANVLEAFTIVAERDAVSPARLERAAVLRRQFGPLCEAQETMEGAELLPALRRAAAEALAPEATR